MMWLELASEDFVDALKRLKPKRGGKATIAQLETQISLIDNEAVLVVNGALKKCPGTGEWKGFVCLDYGFLLPFIKIKPATDVLRLEYQDSKLKIETSRITVTWVESSPWLTNQPPDADFNNIIPEKINYRFCPDCGKRTGLDLRYIPNRTRPTPVEKKLIKLFKTTKSTHGCLLCSHGWIEITFI
jgi:hypothetical protein